MCCERTECPLRAALAWAPCLSLSSVSSGRPDREAGSRSRVTRGPPTAGAWCRRRTAGLGPRHPPPQGVGLAGVPRADAWRALDSPSERDGQKHEQIPPQSNPISLSGAIHWFRKPRFKPGSPGPDPALSSCSARSSREAGSVQGAALQPGALGAQEGGVGPWGLRASAGRHRGSGGSSRRATRVAGRQLARGRRAGPEPECPGSGGEDLHRGGGGSATRPGFHVIDRQGPLPGE